MPLLIAATRHKPATGHVGARPGEVARPPRGNGGQPVREIARERGQFRVGQRDERPGHPLIELVFCQPALHECGLERAYHLFAVGT